MKSRLLQTYLMVALLSTALSGGLYGGDTSHRAGKLSRVFKRGPEQALSVDLRIGTGHLDVGVADPGVLFKGDFLYKSIPPQIAHELVGNKARISIRVGSKTRKEKEEPENVDFSLSGLFKDESILRFTSEIPITMTMRLGAVKGFLELGGLRLQSVSMEVGVSQCLVNFAQPNPETLSLFNVEAGVGKLEMLNLANAGFQHLVFKGGMGSYVLDFGGELVRSGEVDIEVGMGSLTLYLPEEVGVRVEVDKNLFTALNIDDVYKKGNVYYNNHWGKTSQQLDVHLEAGFGKIDIIWK
ncbi:MAG: hypothetical protein D6715_08720 [Calditrichaeota bacterium]|nr:MAG: hypothetical protein D6715_08720 [Calditrichota bacterium]